MAGTGTDSRDTEEVIEEVAEVDILGMTGEVEEEEDGETEETDGVVEAGIEAGTTETGAGGMRETTG